MSSNQSGRVFAGGRRKCDFTLARRLLTLKRGRELKQDGGGLSNYLHGETVKHLFGNNLKGSLARAYANAVLNNTNKKALKGLAAAVVPLAGVGLGVSLMKRTEKDKKVV